MISLPALGEMVMPVRALLAALRASANVTAVPDGTVYVLNTGFSAVTSLASLRMRLRVPAVSTMTSWFCRFRAVTEPHEVSCGLTSAATSSATCSPRGTRISTNSVEPHSSNSLSDTRRMNLRSGLVSAARMRNVWSLRTRMKPLAASPSLITSRACGMVYSFDLPANSGGRKSNEPGTTRSVLMKASPDWSANHWTTSVQGFLRNSKVIFLAPAFAPALGTTASLAGGARGGGSAA